MAIGGMGTVSKSHLNDVFDVLSNARRRYVLYHLASGADITDIAHIARKVAGWEIQDGDGQLNEALIRTVETSIRHVHLPKLAAVDVISYCDEREQIDLNETDGFGLHLLEAGRVEGYPEPALTE